MVSRVFPTFHKLDFQTIAVSFNMRVNLPCEMRTRNQKVLIASQHPAHKMRYIYPKKLLGSWKAKSIKLNTVLTQGIIPMLKSTTNQKFIVNEQATVLFSFYL